MYYCSCHNAPRINTPDCQLKFLKQCSITIGPDLALNNNTLIQPTGSGIVTKSRVSHNPVYSDGPLTAKLISFVVNDCKTVWISLVVIMRCVMIKTCEWSTRAICCTVLKPISVISILFLISDPCSARCLMFLTPVHCSA